MRVKRRKMEGLKDRP